MNSNAIVSAYVQDPDKKELLRIEAAKRGMALSRYVGLLIEKATADYTDFNVQGHDVTRLRGKYQRKTSE